MVTIKEIAEKCGVSEQAIRKWCARNQVAKDVAQHYVIDKTTESLILSHYCKNTRNQVAKDSETSCETNTTMKELVKMLKNELEQKDKQISDLMERLTESHNLLNQQQQLNAMSEQKIKLLEQQTEDRQKKHWWSRNRKTGNT